MSVVSIIYNNTYGLDGLETDRAFGIINSVVTNRDSYEKYHYS